ncbi:hypothetical protein MMC32_002241 [Xylographa parallela]|nr:hypothetical protein [Xylographa parallela]
MAPSSDAAFPTIKSIARINSLDRKHEATQFFDCQFYPYTVPGVDPVFATVGKHETIVCRPRTGDELGVDVVRWFKDDDENNSCAWSQDLATGDPLLCVAGQPPNIKILNVRTGELVQTLIGHGKEINDLAVSPLSPAILASASMDYTVRFWSLDATHEQQPCMLICGGEGHKEGLLTLAFHPSGRYLLTGGMDCVVNLWTIPDLPNDATGTDKPTIIHYPHFSSSAVHTDFIDCVAWYHDLILSKCANENMIVLWRIEGFDSSSTPPSPSSAPTTHEFRPTRSAFGGTYQRLFQFEALETTPFYMRFSLFCQQDKRPILVIGNEKSKVFFWDLQSLEEWEGSSKDADENNDNRFKIPRAKKGIARKILSKQRESSIASTTTTTTNTGSSVDPNSLVNSTSLNTTDENVEGNSRATQKFAVDDPFRTLIPHRTHVVPRVTFASRQIAWSVGGEWMVVVGDQGMIALFTRPV